LAKSSKEETLIKDGDKISIFPPVAGGGYAPSKPLKRKLQKMNAIENKILSILCEKLKKEGIQSTELEELGKEVRTKQDKLLTELLYLRTKGLIDFQDLYNNDHKLADVRNITITNMGIRTIQDEYSQSKDIKDSSILSGSKRDINVPKDLIIPVLLYLILWAMTRFLSPLSNKLVLLTLAIGLIVLIIVVFPLQTKNLLKVCRKIDVFSLLKTNKKIVFILILLIPVAFFLFKRDWSSPKIVITALSPATNAYGNYTTSESVLTIVGNVEDNKKVASLFINNMKIDIAKDNQFVAFAKVITLNTGENKIDIVAFDSLGNKGEKEITVTYVPKVAGAIIAKIQIDSDIITVNNYPVQIDAPAEIKNGRTFLPLRAISEVLGAEVTWISETRGIIVELGDFKISLQIGNPSAVVNGTVIDLEAPPYVKDGRTMVPFRVIAEGLGATVEWDPTPRIMTLIYYPKD